MESTGFERNNWINEMTTDGYSSGLPKEPENITSSSIKFFGDDCIDDLPVVKVIAFQI